MCGRYVSPSEADIERVWNLVRGGNPFPARYNAAPTLELPVIRAHPERGRELALLRWGLIPSWSKDPATGVKLINARADSIAAKPAFRSAFRRRRCLVPMAGFYEWQSTPAGKVPHFIRLLNSELFAVAGLYEWWPGRDDAAPIESFTIITCDANPLLTRLHNRMPAILDERDHDAWLAPSNDDTGRLQAMLAPYPADEMQATPVSARVNNVRNEGPELIAPV